MKITFLSPPPNLSGGERVVAIYAKKLAERGHDVEVVCVDHARIPLTRRVKRFARGRGWPGQPKIGASHFEQYGIRYRVLSHSGPITDRDVNDADAVIATWWETAEWLNELSNEKGAKAYFMQDYGAQGQEIGRITHTWRPGIKIITIAQWLVDLMIEHADSVLDITCVPNSVDTATFYSTDADVRRRSVGLIYNPQRTKRCHIALEAIRIAQSQEQLTAHIIVKGVCDHNFDDRLRILSNISDEELRVCYASSKAWLFPSRREGFGLPILEAMACGTPVIGTPAGAAPELIGEGGGLLVPHDDPAAMAAAIMRILQMPEAEWSAMSDAAYRTATSYTWDDATDLFEKALVEACARS